MKKSHLKRIYFLLLLIISAASLSGCDDKKHHDNNTPSDNLKVVIIRHGEKPKDGDNLSCQGQNRALQLATVLHQKINIPDAIYVPALKSDDETKHSRMFQTISPFAIKYNVAINSKYSADENDKIAKSVFKKQGTVLMVWEHSTISSLASALGVDKPLQWADDDFDSVWVINYHNGKAQLVLDKEQISPAVACSY
ncbi:MAG: histidine phosphatase family protein [Methylophilaceae bacterium]